MDQGINFEGSSSHPLPRFQGGGYKRSEQNPNLRFEENIAAGEPTPW